jgi:hypothetical protein
MLPPSFAGMPLGKSTKFDELGLCRFQCQAKLLQALAQGSLDTKCILSKLETQHKVVNIA